MINITFSGETLFQVVKLAEEFAKGQFVDGVPISSVKPVKDTKAVKGATSLTAVPAVTMRAESPTPAEGVSAPVLTLNADVTATVATPVAVLAPAPVDNTVVKLTLVDVAQAANQVLLKDRTLLVNLLKKFNAAKASYVLPAQYNQFVAECNHIIGVVV